MKPAIRPAARDDIVRQFRYYLVDQDKPDLANRFLEAVEATIGKILRAPNGGAPRRLSNQALANLRSWPVEDFNNIRVLLSCRSARGARNPGIAWQERRPAHS